MAVTSLAEIRRIQAEIRHYLVRPKFLPGASSGTLKKDEMDRRREEGLCFRCGRENCQVSTCPFLPAIMPDTKVRKAKTAAERSRKSQSEDETGSDSESEKE